MVRHRIFIAINLPKEIKEKLLNYQNYWPEVPAKWTKPENLHITLIFLGYVREEEIPKILEIVKETAQKYNSFSINLNKIYYGPPGKMPPRMVWTEGERIKVLTNLKSDLEKSLINSEIRFDSDNREFRPHITLARIRTWEFKQIEPEERPKIQEEISLTFPVNSIEVMESELKRGGAEYTILESASLDKF